MRAYRGGAPSRNSHNSASWRYGPLGRKINCFGIAVKNESGVNLPDGNIVLVGFWVPSLVAGDLEYIVDRARINQSQSASNDTIVRRRIAIYLNL